MLHKRSAAWLGALALGAAVLGGTPAMAQETNAALRYWQAWSVMSPEISRVWAGVPGRDFGSPEATFDADARAMLERHGYTIGVLRRASALHRSDFGMEWELGIEMLLPHLSKVRDGANLLLAHARLAFDNGDRSEAAAALAAALRIAEHNAQDGVVISSLVSMAIAAQCERLVSYTLGAGGFEEADRREIASALARFQSVDPFRLGLALDHERTHFVAWIRKAVEARDFDALRSMFDPNDLDVTGKQAAANVMRAVHSGQGLDAMFRGVDEALALIVDALRLPAPEAVLNPLIEKIRRGEFGDMAVVIASTYPNILGQRARAEGLLSTMKETIGAPR